MHMLYLKLNKDEIILPKGRILNKGLGLLSVSVLSSDQQQAKLQLKPQRFNTDQIIHLQDACWSPWVQRLCLEAHTNQAICPCA